MFFDAFPDAQVPIKNIINLSVNYFCVHGDDVWNLRDSELELITETVL